MNHASLPGQVSIALTWSNLTLLLQNLQNSLKGHWLRSLLLVGEDSNLCSRLEQSWGKTAKISHYPADTFRYTPIPTGNPSSSSQSALSLPTACVPDIKAGYLILSSGLNVWIQLQTGGHHLGNADIWHFFTCPLTGSTTGILATALSVSQICLAANG